MNSSPRLMQAWQRQDRAQRHSYAPVFGFAVLAMVAALAPQVIFAAEPTAGTQPGSAVVFTVIVLLFGSVAAGLFFASPLRGRLMSSPPETEIAPERGREPQPVAMDYATPVQPQITHAWPAPGSARPSFEQQIQQMQQQAPMQPAPMQPMQPIKPWPTPPTQPLQPMEPLEPMQPVQPVEPPPFQPMQSAPVQPSQPRPTQPVQPPHTWQARPQRPAPRQPAITPWSTGAPQPDRNWDPNRRGPR